MYRFRYRLDGSEIRWGEREIEMNGGNTGSMQIQVEMQTEILSLPWNKDN